jgi:hypothetical protein
LLETAKFGLDDMRTRPGRAKTGLRCAIVFGPNTTWALQNLRNVVPGFEQWYAEKQAEMRADPLMKYFADLRTTIEKKAQTPSGVSAYLKSFSDEDVQRLEPRPPGAVGFFFGDRNGGSGWFVQKSDGTREPYYIEVPAEVAEVHLTLPDAPKIAGAQETKAIDLVEQYLAKIEALVREARENFSG